MALEQPAEPRSRFEDGPAGLTILIPAQRHVFAMLFLPVWLVGWGAGWISAAREILSGHTGGGFLLVWILAWTAGGAFAALSFFWMLAGRERVTAEFGVLSHSYELFGLRWKREYGVPDIKRLRVSRKPLQRWYNSNYEWWGWGGGTVAFDYGAKTIRFGAVDEAEAAMIVEHLGKRLRIPFTIDPDDEDTEDDSEPSSYSSDPEADEFWTRDESERPGG